jgi:hypothetical protein
MERTRSAFVVLQADRVGQAGHHVPGAPIDPGRVDPEQYLTVSGLGSVDLLESKDVVGGAVLILDDRFHRLHRGCHVWCCSVGCAARSHHYFLARCEQMAADHARADARAGSRKVGR